jgi:hypothetical protein
MHAMGIDPNAREEDSASRLAAAQDAIFDEIVMCRRCLPIDLLRMPVVDLVELVKIERSSPAIGPVLASLKRYVEVWMER